MTTRATCPPLVSQDASRHTWGWPAVGLLGGRERASSPTPPPCLPLLPPQFCLGTCTLLLTTRCVAIAFSTTECCPGGVKCEVRSLAEPSRGGRPPSRLPRTSHPQREPLSRVSHLLAAQKVEERQLGAQRGHI